MIVQVIMIRQKTWLPGGGGGVCFQKPMDRFQYNLAEMFLWWPSTKIVQAVRIRQKTWPLGVGAYFPYIIYIENLKIFS